MLTLGGCEFPVDSWPTDAGFADGAVLADTIAPCVTFRRRDLHVGPPANVLLLFELTSCEGDPEPGFGADDFIVQENGFPISRFESNRIIFNAQQIFEVQTVLLLDVSDSIVDFPEGLATVRAAVTEFLLSIVGSDTRVQIFVFDGADEIRRLNDEPEPPEIAMTSVSRLVEGVTVDGSTNLNGAIIQGIRRLQALQRVSEVGPRATFGGNLVVFTDGTDRAGRATDASALNAVEESDFKVFTIGVGSETDIGFLRAIGRDRAVNADNLEGLTLAFRAAGEAIVQQSKRFYAMGYCSPLRAGDGELRVDLVGASGDSRSLEAEFAATNFGGGCDSGTLYTELQRFLED